MRYHREAMLDMKDTLRWNPEFIIVVFATGGLILPFMYYISYISIREYYDYRKKMV